MLRVIGLDNKELWDSTVKSFSEYDSYWLSGYVRAFELHGDGEPLLFFYEDEHCRAVNVVMKRDIAALPVFADKVEENTWFDFSTPYGYGGWLVEGDGCDNLFAAYEQWCREHHIVCEFVRFHPMLANHEHCRDAYEVIRLGEVVHMDLTSREQIWNNITSKNRNMIRKALKNDVKIFQGRYPEIFEVFRQIYNQTMDKDEAKSYYYFAPAFYESILNDLPENAQIFYAQQGDEIIAASIMLCANEKMNYHLSGSKRAFSSLAPTNLLLYQAALWGCENGYKTLYLGGGLGSGEDSLFKFKRAFYKGDLHHFYIGKKTFLQQKYDALTALSEADTQSGFFPAYRNTQ